MKLQKAFCKDCRVVADGRGKTAGPLFSFISLACVCVLVFFSTGCSSTPKNQPLPRSTALEAEKFAEYGNSFFNEARYEKAAEMYTLAMNNYIRIDDQLGTTICYNALGKTYLAQGATESAERMFQSAVATLHIFQPIDTADETVKKAAAETYNNLGEFSFRFGEYSKALTWFDKGIELLEPKHATSEAMAVLRHNRGTVFRVQKKLDRARKEFNSALEINTQKENLIEIASNHYMLGVVALQQNQFDTAVYHAQTALEYDKLSEHSVGIGHDLFLLGRGTIEAGENEAGMEYLQRAQTIFTALELDGEREKVVEYLRRNNLE